MAAEEKRTGTAAVELSVNELQTASGGAQDYHVTGLSLQQTLIKDYQTGDGTGDGGLTTNSSQSSSPTKQSRQITIVQDL